MSSPALGTDSFLHDVASRASEGRPVNRSILTAVLLWPDDPHLGPNEAWDRVAHVGLRMVEVGAFVAHPGPAGIDANSVLLVQGVTLAHAHRVARALWLEAGGT